MRSATCTLIAVALVSALPFCGRAIAQTTAASQAAAATPPAAEKVPQKPIQPQPIQQAAAAKGQRWKPLLPAQGLAGWEITDFGGQGEVQREKGQLILERGGPLTGIHYTKGDFPSENYEIELETQRIDGSDFLCGLTFPVGEEFCSLIAGGWGGGVVGLSSVDGYDASENATSTYQAFDNGRWYKFRVRVDPQAVTAWIDDKEVIVQERAGHEFSTRIEVYVSQPLGFCVFDSKVAVRNFRWRPLPSSETRPADKP